MTARFAQSQNSKVKSQKKKGFKPLNSFMENKGKCISRRVEQEILRHCYKPLNLFMGLNFDF